MRVQDLGKPLTTTPSRQKFSACKMSPTNQIAGKCAFLREIRQNPLSFLGSALMEGSCFQRLDLSLHLQLPPYFGHVDRVKVGVCKRLDDKIMRYVEPLKGILLAYSKVKVQNPKGEIIGLR